MCRQRHRTVLAVLLLVGLVSGAAPASAQEQQPVAVGTGGAVATEHPLASAAAVDVLRQGGNAVDAAVAAAAVHGVTRPYSGGLGGGGFLLLRRANGQVVVLDHRKTAPASFGPLSFVDPRTGSLLSAAERTTSGPAVGVPGVALAWEQALGRYGMKTLAEVLAPAIAVAETGFVVDDNYAAETSRHRSRFLAFTSTRETFLEADGSVPAVGSTVRNPDLARTYRILARDGAAAFYSGAVARAIVGTVNDPPLAPGSNRFVLPGSMRLADLRDYRTVTREPTRVSYRGHDVYGVPPPSAGGVTLGLALNLLSGFDLAAMSRADALHHYLEASRVAFADRGRLGDPALWSMPTAGLLSAGYADARRPLIRSRAATNRVSPGDPWPYQPGGATAARAADPGATADVGHEDPPWDPHDDESTIHLTVADDAGNVVAYTSTIVTIGGNGMVVPGHGFLLNDSLAGRIPGSNPHAPNQPRPGMRPLSSMSPTIVEHRGQPEMAIGSPGGTSIMTTVLQTLVEWLDRGAGLPDAIAAPRLSQRNLASTATEVEPAFRGTPEEAALQSRGHLFQTSTLAQGIGAATGFERLADGRLLAAAEPWRRGGGAAMVVWPTPEQVTRLGDRNRVGTAVRTSQRSHPQGAASVVVARADDYADALAGGPLAAVLDGPVLLSTSARLPAAVAEEVRRLGARHAVLLGGTAALAPSVAADLAAAGVDTIERVGGADRFDTARRVAGRLPPTGEALVVEGRHPTPGRGWPDALSASGLAAARRTPILLAVHDRLPQATVAALDARGVDRVTIVGGTAAVSQDVEDELRGTGRSVERLAGDDRYATSRAVAQRAVEQGASPARTWLATGRAFPDGLAAGPAAVADDGVLVLVDGRGLDRSPAARDWVTGAAPLIDEVVLVGGTAALGGRVEQDLAALLAAP